MNLDIGNGRFLSLFSRFFELLLGLLLKYVLRSSSKNREKILEKLTIANIRIGL